MLQALIKRPGISCGPQCFLEDFQGFPIKVNGSFMLPWQPEF